MDMPYKELLEQFNEMGENWRFSDEIKDKRIAALEAQLAEQKPKTNEDRLLAAAAIPCVLEMDDGAGCLELWPDSECPTCLARTMAAELCLGTRGD